MGASWADNAVAQAVARNRAIRAAGGGAQSVQNYVNSTPARQAAAADPALRGQTPTQANLNAYNRGYATLNTPTARRTTTPAAPATRNTGSSGGSRGGGGGGGGGGAAAPQYSQAQLDWMAQMMNAAAPSGDFAKLDLPDYQAYQPKAFDDSYYTGLEGNWNQAVQQDVGTANQATQNLLSFLGSNYQNAFNNPNAQYATAGQAPGMDQQAMARLMQSQGVNPNVNQANVQAQATADAGFGNLWKTLAGNEDMAQRNRLNSAQMSGTDAVNRLNALGLGGRAGINMQKGQAKSQYDQRVEEWAREDAAAQQAILQQEAQGNWQRGNEVAGQQQEFRNAQLEALLGLMTELKGTNLQMPTAQTLGWQPYPAGASAQDPHGWAAIDASMRAQGLR